MHDTTRKIAPEKVNHSGEEIRRRLRQEMPIVERFAYFDHAAVAPLPARSGAAMKRFADEAVILGDTVWPSWAMATEQLRSDLAELVCSKPSEIALVPNTTTAIGIVAEGFPWAPGDSVVVPANEFPSNLTPWRNLKRRGVQVREVAACSNGRVDLEKIVSAIDSTTRLVAISWVGFVSGFRIDVGRLADAVHQRGALLLLDAIQGLGVFPMDLTATGVDFLAADGHKWMLGPEGAGMLFVRESHLNRLDPILVGWHSLDEGGKFDPTSQRLKSTAARYEGGSANMSGLIGFGQSVRLLLDCGATKGWIASCVLENIATIAERLSAAGFSVHVPPSEIERSGILTLDCPGSDLMAIRKHCMDDGVVLSVRAGRLRVSTHAYNNEADIDRLVNALTTARVLAT